ncbi:MAG TPA: hypothetical protein VIM61_10150 [Chthoniobacterales bacterium]|jgi:hypothetical protein
MSNLTDADKRAFTDKVISGLTGNTPALVAAGWDPAQRLATLKNGHDTVSADETLIAQLEVALKTATDNRRKDLEDSYALASATVKAVEGFLGKDHPFVIDLRQIRGSFSQEPAAPAVANP